jgi:hypothetical protein
MAPCCHEWTRPGTTRRHAGRRRFARTRRCPPVGLASSSTASARNAAATSPPEGSPRSAAAFTVAARRTADVERGPWRRAAVAPVSGRWRCAAQRHCRRWRWTADRRRDCARVLGRVRVGRRETRHPQCSPTTTTDGDGRFTVCGLPSDMPLSCGRRSARQRARSSKRERAAGSRPLRRPSDDRPPDRARAVNAEDTDPAPRSGGCRPATSFDENAPRRGYSSHR